MPIPSPSPPHGKVSWGLVSARGLLVTVARWVGGSGPAVCGLEVHLAKVKELREEDVHLKTFADMMAISEKALAPAERPTLFSLSVKDGPRQFHKIFKRAKAIGLSVAETDSPLSSIQSTCAKLDVEGRIEPIERLNGAFDSWKSVRGEVTALMGNLTAAQMLTKKLGPGESLVSRSNQLVSGFKKDHMKISPRLVATLKAHLGDGLCEASVKAITFSPLAKAGAHGSDVPVSVP